MVAPGLPPGAFPSSRPTSFHAQPNSGGPVVDATALEEPGDLVPSVPGSIALAADWIGPAGLAHRVSKAIGHGPAQGGIYREHALEGSTPSSTTSSLLSAVTSLTTIRHSVPDSFATASIRTTVSGL